MLPGCSPSAMTWHARQLPLLFSMASAFPGAGGSAPKTAEIPLNVMKIPANTSLARCMFLVSAAAETLFLSTIILERRITDKLYSLSKALAT